MVLESVIDKGKHAASPLCLLKGQNWCSLCVSICLYLTWPCLHFFCFFWLLHFSVKSTHSLKLSKPSINKRSQEAVTRRSLLNKTRCGFFCVLCFDQNLPHVFVQPCSSCLSSFFSHVPSPSSLSVVLSHTHTHTHARTHARVCMFCFH